MNILQIRKDNEKSAILAHLQANGGKTINELREAIPINIGREAYRKRMTELQKENRVYPVAKPLGRTSVNVWHFGPEPKAESSKREIELPPIALAMGYRHITPQRGRRIEEKHSHRSLARVSVGIQSGMSCVWPDHG